MSCIPSLHYLPHVSNASPSTRRVRGCGGLTVRKGRTGEGGGVGGPVELNARQLPQGVLRRAWSGVIWEREE